jgi:hypothetical protein
MTDPRWSDETLTVVARAICKSDSADVDRYDGCMSQGMHRMDAAVVLTALADAGMLCRVRTWNKDDPEPDVPAVRDKDDDVWLRVDGGWRHSAGWRDEPVPPVPWTSVAKYAPIVATEVPS